MINILVQPKIDTSAPSEVKNDRVYKKILSKIANYFEKYCEMTTLHGFRYLTEKNISLMERVFWMIAIITTTICGCNLIYISIKKYQSSPLISQVDPVGTNVWDIPFPAITICNVNQLKSSVFNYSEVMNKPNITSFERKQLAVADMLCDTDDEGDYEFLDPDVFDYMIKYAVPALNETVDNAMKMTKSVMEYFQTSLTPDGVCHTLNGLPHKKLFKNNYFEVIEEVEKERGEYISKSAMKGKYFWDRDIGYPTNSENVYPWRVRTNGLSGTTLVLLKYNPNDYDENCNKGSRGFSISVHSPMEQSSTFTNKMFLEPNKLMKVYIQVEKQETSELLRWWSPRKRGCYFSDERDLMFYLNYTQRNCENECRSLISYKYCGCILFYNPRNSSIPICGPKKWACVWENFKRSQNLNKEKDYELIRRCDCLVPCKFTLYMTEFSRKLINISSRSFYKNLLRNYSEK